MSQKLKLKWPKGWPNFDLVFREMQNFAQISLSCFAKFPSFFAKYEILNFAKLRKRNFLATLARIVHRKSLTFLFELNTGFLLSKSLKYFLKVSLRILKFSRTKSQFFVCLEVFESR